ncbi:SMI1/KNR4 family protein [Paenibacillus wenxiniae]|uniref:SMI1/KNR4 family protein n=1 Tax=Paenibacillus wenxiniae TaxID=1636843 RepID=A0ABW4RDU7_9BACL
MDQSLQARLDRYPYSHTRNTALPQWIAAAKQELRYRLPDSYVGWLTHYGSLFFNRQDGVYSLAPPEFRDDAVDDLLYNYRLDAEADWLPAGRLYIYHPDEDESYYWDVSKPVHEPSIPVEYPMMRVDHMDGLAEVYANSFAEFVDRMLTARGY